MERTIDGATVKAVALIGQLNSLASGLPAPLQREINMVVHKIAFPMNDILLKVPGTTLTDRAKKLKVSRQTMYVWLSEKFRPTRVQAKRIAKVTGVPIEHIVDDGFEDDDTRKSARKKVARMATRSAENSKRAGRTGGRRRGSVDAGGGEEPVGDVHQPVG